MKLGSDPYLTKEQIIAVRRYQSINQNGTNAVITVEESLKPAGFSDVDIYDEE